MNYTSIEQSKKLLELGLNPESADMWYSIVDNEAFICLELHDEYEQIPAWSLNALLESTPKYFFKSNHLFAQTIKYDCNDGLYHFFYRDYQYSGISKTAACIEDLLDGAFKMVVWLIENGYIKTNK